MFQRQTSEMVHTKSKQEICAQDPEALDWDWWRSPVIAASVRLNLVDIVRQGA